jgi:acyl-CoA synthetase (AMP-forming)/AMP-acid ligase II
MMISMMAPEDHRHADGSVATGRLSSAGRVGPLVRVGIMNGNGKLMPAGERGEIVVRGSLVMDAYYKNAEATAEASVHGWHHTGDIGYLDSDNFLYIVDRAKDMIIWHRRRLFDLDVPAGSIPSGEVITSQFQSYKSSRLYSRTN